VVAKDKQYQLKPMDLTSIFVNNLEENTTEEELREYFKDCGTIEKITIRNDKMTGLLYSYLQFTEQAAVEDAILLSDGMIRGRKIKVPDT
jgi:polyadenylate-binding protein 2